METIDLRRLALALVVLGIGIAGPCLQSWRVSSSVFYLFVGTVAGPLGMRLFSINVAKPFWLKSIARFALCAGLFSSGLKLRAKLNDKVWLPSMRLATLAVAASVFLVSLFGVYVLKLPLGLSVVLGAILSPTDPVLASAVDLIAPGKRDRLRFTFTGRARRSTTAQRPRSWLWGWPLPRGTD